MANLLILVGYGGKHDDPNLEALIEALKVHLKIPVQTAFLESSPSVGESIQAGVSAYSPQYVIVLPLFVGANDAKNKNVQMIVDGANERGFDMVAYYGKPLGTQAGVIAAYSELVVATLPNGVKNTETALLVVGRGSRDAASNAEIYQMARLLYENVECSFSDVAFYGTTKPDIATGIKRCVQMGARRIVALPYVLYDPNLFALIQAQIRQQQALYPDVEILTTAPLETPEGIVNAVSQRYAEALVELKSRLSSDGKYVSLPHSHGAGGSHSHRVPDFSSEMLPPRYQGDSLVSAAPMGAADLIFDAEGRVVWDQIWGDFCDLALAGGPPHRGTLLEPVAPETVHANRQRYLEVLAELERGIRMITKLPVVMSQSPCWIGLQCTDEAMALWLLRAIVVENISVRREGTVLYFPAGPDFRLEYEIKNIITVVAKTHHYWTEHITNTSSP